MMLKHPWEDLPRYPFIVQLVMEMQATLNSIADYGRYDIWQDVFSCNVTTLVALAGCALEPENEDEPVSPGELAGILLCRDPVVKDVATRVVIENL